MKIDVLGAEYTLAVIRGSKEPRLKDCDGFCDERDAGRKLRRQQGRTK